MPRGWRKSPKQIILPAGELLSHLSFDGVPNTLDLIPGILGPEFKLIAKTLEGNIVDINFSGIMIVSKVMRNSVLRYPAGTRVHELTDEDGNIYVLLLMRLTPLTLIDLFEKTDALLNYPRPRGWFYSSRIIDEDLLLSSNGLVNVLAIRAETSSVWEKRSAPHT